MAQNNGKLAKANISEILHKKKKWQRHLQNQFLLGKAECFLTMFRTMALLTKGPQCKSQDAGCTRTKTTQELDSTVDLSLGKDS